MKILHVITRLILGGAQQNTLLSCAGQVAAGHEVHLAYGPIYGPEGSLLEEGRASGATLHEIPSMVRAVHPIQDWRCVGELRALIRGLRPGIVHTHSSKAGITGRVAGWAEKQGGLPKVVHTVHGLPFYDGQNPLVHRLYIGLERYAARRCDHLIGITPAMAEAFEENKIASVDRFTIVPSGVDLSPYKGLDRQAGRRGVCDRFDIPQDRRVIGLVARLDPLKGHRDLIAALPEIIRQHDGVHVLFVGDGFDRPGIEQAIQDSPHRDHITLAGLVPLDEMPGVYACIDVLVLPSYQEGQSRVLVEGLAAGCATVGYDVGGIPAVLEASGRLVPVGDKEALAGAINDWLADEDAQNRIEAGRHHVTAHYSAETMNQQLLACYERLLRS
ncbi:glycosyltransferase family 4 protein [Mucisphaera calidilacus]|uniref:2-deoxystreptamine glucosyltransferase n=1 Tax=Mucisphaera calidilacus TaxID=2527982 RepID=A0A518BW91_9BACT|nr:glycosyltransferase family 4 protein [Mucisphaera calidilacus]QDU71237.1 2-deoxystreptamine glucosyltransferase [Mucisphaera calidilacus]